MSKTIVLSEDPANVGDIEERTVAILTDELAILTGERRIAGANEDWRTWQDMGISLTRTEVRRCLPDLTAWAKEGGDE